MMPLLDDKDVLTCSPPDCARCQLSRTALHPHMLATGAGERRLLIVAEAPGAHEDETGIQLVGESGELVRSTLRELGWDLERDCRKINVVNCRPPANRTPTVVEVECCRPMVLAEIRSFSPRVVLLLGSSATLSVITPFSGNAFAGVQGGAFPLLRGVPVSVDGVWYVTTYHPAYLLRNRRDQAMKTVWRRDIRLALHLAKTNPPHPRLPSEKECCRALLEDDQAVAYLNSCLGSMACAIDVETNHLSPYVPGARIASVGVACSPTKAAAFRFTPAVMEPLRKLMTTARGVRVFHNMVYDLQWLEHFLDVRLQGSVSDTILLAHIEDNRRHYTGLDRLSFLHLGVKGYKTPMKAYTHSSTANGFNRVEQAPIHSLLYYNATDALYTLRLWDLFRKAGYDTAVR